MFAPSSDLLYCISTFISQRSFSSYYRTYTKPPYWLKYVVVTLVKFSHNSNNSGSKKDEFAEARVSSGHKFFPVPIFSGEKVAPDLLKDENIFSFFVFCF